MLLNPHATQKTLHEEISQMESEYMRLNMTITEFDSEVVITTSGVDFSLDERENAYDTYNYYDSNSIPGPWF